MWSYYSSAHQSFAYEFSCESEEGNAAARKLGAIKYLEERPSISPVDVVRWLVNTSREGHRYEQTELELSESEYSDISDALILAKSSVWKHEREWRALRSVGEQAGYFSIRPYSLTAVVFGSLCSLQLKAFVKENLGTGVTYRDMVLDQTGYELSFAD